MKDFFRINKPFKKYIKIYLNKQEKPGMNHHSGFFLVTGYFGLIT